MTVKNLAASVQARLQNRARESKRPFQELLQYFAMEWFSTDSRSRLTERASSSRAH